MIQNAGFDNFRKFVHLDPQKLGGVTFLVGENNSGKSTFTKGILLLSYFLDRGNNIDRVEDNSADLKPVNFKDELLRNIYIDSFYQALCSHSTSGEITLDCRLNDYEIRASICIPGALRNTQDYKNKKGQLIQDGYDENLIELSDWTPEVYSKIRHDNPEFYKKELDKSEARFNKIEIADYKRGILFCVHDELKTVNIAEIDKDLSRQIDTINALLERFNSESIEYSTLLAQKVTLRKSLFEKAEINQSPYRYSLDRPHMIDWLIWSEKKLLMNRGKNTTDSKRQQLEDIMGPKIHCSNPKLINNAEQSYKQLKSTLESFKLEYLYTHSVHQLSSYRNDPLNQGNYVDQTISQFWKLKDVPKKYDNAKKFVRKWMNRFSIGEDFKIFPEEGTNNLKAEIMDNDIWQDLSTKGIGAIQLFLLILRIGIIISENNCGYTTIIVEEPEQNLHPALQSRLTDFFYEINKEYGCQFIVETHSEYMVRKSQVIVAQEFSTERKVAKNPFRVLYFPKEGSPYKMSYTKDGDFREEFGTGFYDSASELYQSLIDAKKRR